MSSIFSAPGTAYPAGRTALLFVDPYNDFLAEGGKLWSNVANVAKTVGLHENLRTVTNAVRQAGFPVFIVPHHRRAPPEWPDFRSCDSVHRALTALGMATTWTLMPPIWTIW